MMSWTCSLYGRGKKHKTVGEKPLQRPRKKLDENIKMELREKSCEDGRELPNFLNQNSGYFFVSHM
jgi:hypothetical protein